MRGEGRKEGRKEEGKERRKKMGNKNKLREDTKRRKSRR